MKEDFAAKFSSVSFRANRSILTSVYLDLIGMGNTPPTNRTGRKATAQVRRALIC